MLKKLTTLILTACMTLSIFSGLSLTTLADETAAEKENNTGISGDVNALLQSGGNMDDITASGSEVYKQEDDTSVKDNQRNYVELMDASSLMDEANNLGITRYTALTDNDEKITRAQMAELIAGCMYKDTASLMYYKPAHSFSDIYENMGDAYTYKAILWCADEGYINGIYNEEDQKIYFRPDELISKSQAAMLIYRITGRNDSGYTGGCHINDISDNAVWYYIAVMNLFELGILSADTNNNFNPNTDAAGMDILQWLVNFKHYITDRTVFTYDELFSALTDPVVHSVNVTRDITVPDTVPENTVVTINKDIRIYGRQSLYMDRRITLVIGSGATLEFDGSDPKGSVIESGNLVISEGGTLVCNQNTFINEKTSCTISGTVIVRAGSTLQLNGDTVVNGNIQLNESYDGNINGAGLLINHDLAGNGTITRDSGDIGNVQKCCWVGMRTDYVYQNGVPVCVSSAARNVIISGDVFISEGKIITVNNTEEFNDAYNSDAHYIAIKIAGDVTVTSFYNTSYNNFMDIFICPGATLTFSGNVTVPDNVLIKFLSDDSGVIKTYGNAAVTDGSVVTVLSDWKKYEGIDNVHGLYFNGEDQWQNDFGGIVAGFKDGVYLEYYFSKDTVAGNQIKSYALSMDKLIYLVYCGNIAASLGAAGDITKLSADTLVVAGGAKLTVENGFTLKLGHDEPNSGWRSANEDNKYGCDYYYNHSAEPGYVMVNNGASIDVEGTLDVSENVNWTEIIAINPGDSDKYPLNQKGVVYNGPLSSYGTIEGLSPDAYIVVFAGNNETWSGNIDLNGGYMSVGANGYVHAYRVWIGLNNQNIYSPGCGFTETATSNVKLDGWLGRSVMENLTVSNMEVPGDLDIRPGCILNVGDTLTVSGSLRVYGTLNINNAGGVNVGGGIHVMHYFDKTDNIFKTASLSGITDYFVGVEDQWALADLLKSALPSNISILFNWYLNKDISQPLHGDVEINTNVYTPYSIQVFDGCRLTVDGILRCGTFTKADGAIIKANSIAVVQNGYMEAENGGRIIAGDAVNNGDINAYNRGQIWFTGSVTNNGRFYQNVYYNGLAARWLDWYGNIPHEDTNSDLQNRLVMQKCARSFIFYKMTYNKPTAENAFGSWALTPIPASSLSLSRISGGDIGNNSMYIVVTSDGGSMIKYPDYSQVTLTDWDNFTVSYTDTVSGNIYSMDLDTELPQVGFYTSPYKYTKTAVGIGNSVAGMYTFDSDTNSYKITGASDKAEAGVDYYTQSYGADKKFWTENISYTPNTQKTFYLIYNDEINPEEYSDYCTTRDDKGYGYSGTENITYSKIYGGDSTVWEVKLKDGVNNSFNLMMGAKIQDNYGHTRENAAWLNLNAEEYEHLVWVHADRISNGQFSDNEQNSETVSGDGWYGAFYFYCKDNAGNWHYQPVDGKDIKLTGDPTGISLYELTGEGNAKYYNLTFIKEGNYTFTYSGCTFGVDVNVINLPDIGVYSSPEGGKANYLNDNMMSFADYRTVYIIPLDVRVFDSMDLSKTSIGGGRNGMWEEHTFDNNPSVTVDGLFTVTAVDKDAVKDGIYDYFKVDFLANPLLTGWMNLSIKVRDKNNDEYLSRNFGFNTYMEWADSMSGGSMLLPGADNAVNIEGIESRTAKFFEFDVGGEDTGYYVFRMNSAGIQGNFGMYIFGADWKLLKREWRYVSTNDILSDSIYLAPGKYYIAVYNDSGTATTSGAVLAALKSAQPAKPTTANASLNTLPDPGNVYSIILSKGSSDITTYRLYALIGGKWTDRGFRDLWYDNYMMRWNDSYCYLTDILGDGETAAAFGVAAVNADGVESEMLVLTPEHPVTRIDSYFSLSDYYNVKLTRMPNGDTELTAIQNGQNVIFDSDSANRIRHFKFNGTDIMCDCDRGFGNGNNTTRLNGFIDTDLTQYAGGYWEYLISRQQLGLVGGKDAYIVGWSSAALDCDRDVPGTDRGSIDVGYVNTWIVQDWGDLSSVSDFRYNGDMQFCYTPNSSRFWLGTYSTAGCRYTEIKSGLTATNGVVVNYDKDRWNFDLSDKDAGDTFSFVYTVDGNAVASVPVTVVNPEAAFFNSLDVSKASFSGNRICSTQKDIYFIWNENYESGRGFTSCDISVFRRTQYVPGDGKTYYTRNDKGEFVEITQTPANGVECFIEDNGIVTCENHFADKYIKISSKNYSGDYELGVALIKKDTSGNTIVVDYRSIWVEQAVYMKPVGTNGIGCYVAEGFGGSEFGIASSQTAAVMEATCSPDANRNLYFGNLTPGITYYLYYKYSNAWVLVNGVSSTCFGIAGITASGGTAAVNFALDGSYESDRLVMASYTNDKMSGVKMITLTKEIILTGNIQTDLAAGDTYKVFILSGDGKYTLKVFSMMK